MSFDLVQGYPVSGYDIPYMLARDQARAAQAQTQRREQILTSAGQGTLSATVLLQDIIEALDLAQWRSNHVSIRALYSAYSLRQLLFSTMTTATLQDLVNFGLVTAAEASSGLIGAMRGLHYEKIRILAPFRCTITDFDFYALLEKVLTVTEPALFILGLRTVQRLLSSCSYDATMLHSSNLSLVRRTMWMQLSHHPHGWWLPYRYFIPVAGRTDYQSNRPLEWGPIAQQSMCTTIAPCIEGLEDALGADLSRYVRGFW